MRYKLDLDGYVVSVAFGCYLDKCTEYTGTVPIGYNSLDAWATYACINAYYIDSNGNLAYDAEREGLLKEKEAQDAIDNTPLIRKDLYESEAVLDSQYIKATDTGEVIILEDIRPISPSVKITGVDASKHKNLYVYTHGKNMMPCNAKGETINGVTFTKAYSGAITASGVSTGDIEYTIAGSASNTIPLFVLKKDHNYYLNLGGFECELRYYDGDITKQQYVGASGLINLGESIEVTQVLIKIPGDTPLYPSETLYPGEAIYPTGSTMVNVTFLPQLEYGKKFTSYEAYKCKSLSIDFSEAVDDGDTVDYILIEKGVIYISVDGIERVIGSGNVGLYSAYNVIYATKDSSLDITYSTNVYEVESLEFLQGKATTTNKFKILKDGSIEANNGYFSGKVEATSGSFKGKVEADSGYFKGRVEASEGSFKGKVEADSGYFKGKVEADSGYFKGKVEATSGSFKGKVEADSGYFKGRVDASEGTFKGTIETSSAIITGGTISVGSNFKVESGGFLTAYYGTIGPWKLTPETFITEDYGFQITRQTNGTWGLHNTGVGWFDGDLVTQGQLSAGSMIVSGTKSRLAPTENYGERLLYCYETPSPMFGDIGEGNIDDTGKCYVFLDDVFAETVDTDCVYQVFLQPYGDGKCYVSERTGTYFVVCGTENMHFGWEVKAIQKDYDTIRLEEPYQEETDATAEALNATGNYLKSLLYNVESEVI